MYRASDPCEKCPAWSKHVGQDGKEILVELRGPDGQPVTKDGAPRFEMGDDDRFLRHGSCRLRAPQLIPTGITGYPTTKSNWFCFDPDRLAMIDRLNKEVINVDA